MKWERGQWLLLPDGCKARVHSGWLGRGPILAVDTGFWCPIDAVSAETMEGAKPIPDPVITWPEPLPEPGDVIEFTASKGLWFIKKSNVGQWYSHPLEGQPWGRAGWSDLSALLADMEDKLGPYRIVGNIRDFQKKEER